ncbi:2-amino-4-hydroxy-6-hydroxymethyldihydropteridine diphosphokinase [Lentisphaera profundi]|uniref:2-amino-4-hydroxy-6-hydroxymethyldihydropteridine pyrophosphokinase n=1 Tax=Lentisphaera profundi TaxID=1658616 RepID=A0ABY7VRR4_9BACT|nr:2-amino-4-hydroxy-6-hydroxymethyldihydropteridine diphosphokinase [Lentisphaera profundi]WDE96571.1 2-amino-4-hydroxy-6-hydroxymethyldihydropteridine diphosphokinase [Lentisphaera profundi]
MMKKVALALGSNMGEREVYFDYALKRLVEEGLENLRMAQIVESDPMYCPEGSGLYLNSALIADWDGEALDLLQLCLKIEKEAGRERSGIINESRYLDLDVLLIAEDTYDLPDLIVPHPRMLERDFVLGPLAELASEWLIPGANKTVGQCLAEIR